MRDKLIIALFLASFVRLSAQTQTDLSRLSQDDRYSIEMACSNEKLNLGPAAYHRCLQKQLDALAGTGSPDLSGLSQDDRYSIEMACSNEKLNLGPAAYHRCLQKQLDALAGTGSPDLSGLSQDDRYSIEMACSNEKLNLGPAAYHRCLQKQLDALAGTGSPDLSGLSQDDRYSIEMACSNEKLNLGPAAYHRCIAKQLRALAGGPDLGQSADSQRSTAFLSQQQTFPSRSTATDASRSPGSDSELKRLDYFVGIWTLKGTINTSLLGPGGKFTGTHRNEWGTDRLSLVSHWDEQRRNGVDSGQAVYRYDSDQKTYKYHGVDSTGESEDSTGTVEGKTWIWTSNPTMENGETVKAHFTMSEVSSTSYSFRFEIAQTDGEWTTVMEGNAVKTK